MVLSDESSSDTEDTTDPETPRTGQKTTRSKSSVSQSRHDRGQSNASKATDERAAASNKPWRWKRIQSSFPVISGRKSHVSSGPPSSPDDEVFCNPPEYSTSPTMNGQVLEVPAYVPHHKGLLDTDHEYRGHKTRYRHDTGLEDVTTRDAPESHAGRPGASEELLRSHSEGAAGSSLPKTQPLRKLVLSNEEKSSLLDWSISKQERSAGKRRPPAPPQGERDPGGESGSKGKSAFSILSNAIKRSFSRSLSSVPESPKPLSERRDGALSPSSSYLDAALFRRSRSDWQRRANPSDTETDFASNNSKRLNDPQNGHFNANNGLLNPQTSGQNSRAEDFMPRMMENCTLKENRQSDANPDPPFRGRRNSFFSSLRLKKSENALNPPNETWSVFSSLRRKVNERESGEKSRMSNAPVPPPSPHAGSQFKGGRMAKSEDFGSSSDDEELKRKRSSSFKSSRTSKHRKKMEREARQKAKQEELKRLHKAQTIQRQLQEVEEKQRALEVQGVKLEKAIRGEADSGPRGEPQLLHAWFQLALEKHKLSRYESDLLCVARELDLEDQQSRLEQQLRERMLVDPSLKGEKDVAEEQEIFAEMMRIVEQRDRLVTHVEEQRLRQNSEEEKLHNLPLPRECQMRASALSKRVI